MSQKNTTILNIIAIVLSVLSIMISLCGNTIIVDSESKSVGISGSLCTLEEGDKICYKNRSGNYTLKEVAYCENGYVYVDISVNHNGSAYMGINTEDVYKVILDWEK